MLTRRAERVGILALALLLPVGAWAVVASSGAAHRERASDRLIAHVQPSAAAREMPARTTAGSATPREPVACAIALLLLALAGCVVARRRSGVRHARTSRAPPALRSV